ncbi:MAG: DASS family sodium-coupled anion symporter [candidate division WOR-3 bacterium]
MKNNIIKKIIYITLILLISLGIYFIPIAHISEPAKRTLSILTIAALFWITEIIPLYITSFVILFLEAIFLTNQMGGNFKIFLVPFFDSVIVLFLGGLVLAQALKKYDLDEWFTFIILKRIGNKPSQVLIGFMAVTAFLSMWMSNTATTALMIGLVIVLTQNIPQNDPLITALALGIPFSANIGGIATPIGTPPNALTISILQSKNINITFLGWMILGLPLTVILFFIVYLVLKKYFKSSLKEINLIQEKNNEFSREQKLILGVFLVTVLLWLTYELHKIPTSIVALLPVIIFSGSGLLKEEDFGRIGWDTLILMGGGLSLGMTIEKSGLSSWFVSQINFASFPNIVLLISITLITIFLTSFISNTSAAAILLPIAVSLSSKSIGPALTVGLSASIAMVLPVSTPPNAIAYGSGLIKTKDMVKYGGIVAILSAIVITLVVLLVSLLIK